MTNVQTSQQLPPEHRPGTPQRLAFLWRTHIVERNREERVLISASFTTMFLLVRFITHSIRDQRFRRVLHNLSAGKGLHLHHLVFGIVGLLATGYTSAGFMPSRRSVRRLLAISEGMSAALTIDEFALWLRLKDVYWAKQGRESVDAAIATAGASLGAIAGREFLTEMAKDTATLWRDAVRRTSPFACRSR